MSEATVGELSDLLWERVLALDPLTAQRAGRHVDALPRGGPEAMEREVSFAVSTLGRLAGIDGVDAAFLRDHLEQEAAEARRFWYRFPVTPYNALPLSLYREEIFAAAELRLLPASLTSARPPVPETGSTLRAGSEIPGSSATPTRNNPAHPTARDHPGPALPHSHALGFG